MRLHVIVGLFVVASAVSSASAEWLEVPGYTGPITMKATSAVMCTQYPSVSQAVSGFSAMNAVPGATGYAGAGPSLNAFYSDAGATVASGDASREDFWGITQFTMAYVTGCSDVNAPGSRLYKKGVGSRELTALMYGGVHDAMAPFAGWPSGGTMVSAAGVTIDIYENPAGSFDSAGGLTQGSRGRLGFDSYNGITNVAGGSLIARLTSAAGAVLPGWELTSMYSQGPGSQIGTQSSFFNVEAGIGSWGPKFDSNAVAGGLCDVTSSASLLSNNGSLTGGVVVGTGNGPWTMLVEDPFRASIAVPEPLTLSVLGLGLGLLFARRPSASRG